MEKEVKKEESSVGNLEKYSVHHVLAHSYSFYFFVLILAVFLDLIFPIKVFSDSVMAPIGFVLLVLASLLILWAQRTSRDLRKIENITKQSFCRGPYCYTRSPTHWGLFVLMLGFGFIVNALFVILFTLISLVVTKLVFLKKEEAILVDKYGASYVEYKKSVKF
jgi:protein-S-isoprenylcysteine O-methyltransferase Ste14